MTALAWLPLLGGCPEAVEAPGADGGNGDARVVDAPIAIDSGGPGDGGGGADASVQVRCPDPEACDPRTDTGCDVSRVCVLVSQTPSCELDTGSRAEGTECTAVGECASGLACFATRDGTGMCDRLCCDEADCGASERCGAGRLVDGTSVSYGRCLPEDEPCDLLEPVVSCEPAEGCYVLSSAGETGCRPAGTSAVGRPCREPNDCAPGLACRGLTNPTCRRICDATDPDSCPAGEGECADQPLWPDDAGLCTLDLVSLVN